MKAATSSPSYLTAVAYFTGLGWPFFAVLALLAEPAIRLLFGPQWEASIPLTRIACLAAAISLPWTMLSNVANAMGQPQVVMRIELRLLLLVFVLVILAAGLSLEAVAWSLCGASAAQSWLVVRALRQLIGVRLRDRLSDLLKSAGISLICVVGALPGIVLVPSATGEAARFAVGACGAAVAWVVAVIWLRHPFRTELLRASRARWTRS